MPRLPDGDTPLMEWKLLGSTFVVVFLAELGDKTQLATFGLAASAGSRLSVFLGAATALAATSAIAVLLGSLLGGAIPEIWMRRLAGGLFLALGVAYLAGKGW